MSALLLLLVALPSAACCVPIRIRHGVVITPRPIWTTDLRPLGFYVDERSPSGLMTAIEQLAFGSDEELVVIGAKGAPPKEPNPVRAFVLDAQSGKVIRQVEWVGRVRPDIHATAAGHYVVSTIEGVRLFSGGLERVIRSVDGAVRAASPDGRTFTIWGGVPGRATTTFHDAESFLPTGAVFINRAVDSVASNRITYVAYRGGSRHASIFIEDAGRKFPPYDADCSEARARFVAQDVMAVFGCRRMTVVTVEGKVLFTESIPEEDRWVAPASRDGRRFAVVSTYESAAHSSTTCFERIRVYEVETGDVLFKAEIRDCSGTLGGSGVALSPDGRLLAVNSLGVVRVFRLPDPDPGPERAERRL
jgi:hypothetical protein